MAKRFRNRYVDIGPFCDEDGIPSAIITREEEILAKDHSFFLSFLNMDLSREGELGTRLTEYFGNVIDRGAFYETPETVYRLVSSLHPYFGRNIANASVLLNRIASSVIRFYISSASESGFMTVIFASRGLGDCNAQYWLDEDPGKFCPLPKEDCLAPLADLQDRLRTAAVLLLDSSSDIFSKASPVNRMALYSLTSGRGASPVPFVKMRSAYYYPRGKKAADLDARLDFSDESDILSSDRLSADIANIVRDPSADAPSVRAALSSLEGAENILRVQILEPDSLEELLFYELMEMFESGIMVSRDPDGKFVVPENTGRKNAGSEEDTADAMYKKAYKTHHRRVMNGDMTKEQLDEWRKSAKEMMAGVLDGTVPLSDFSMWLKI